MGAATPPTGPERERREKEGEKRKRKEAPASHVLHDVQHRLSEGERPPCLPGSSSTRRHWTPPTGHRAGHAVRE
eukprot:2198409-Pyramimonas_sp.AAC.1